MSQMSQKKREIPWLDLQRLVYEDQIKSSIDAKAVKKYNTSIDKWC